MARKASGIEQGAEQSGRRMATRASGNQAARRMPLAGVTLTSSGRATKNQGRS